MGYKFAIEGLVLIFIFSFIMILPCVGLGWVGYKMMNQLGRYPSRASEIQLKALVKLLVIEVFAFLLLIGFYQIFHE